MELNEAVRIVRGWVGVTRHMTDVYASPQVRAALETVLAALAEARAAILEPGGWEERCKRTEAERETLRAERGSLLEQLARKDAERNELRAEVARLRGDVESLTDRLSSVTEDYVKERNAAEKAEAALRELREWMSMEGYHAPGKCHHGLTHWIGDHCAFDCAALRDTAPAEEEKPLSEPTARELLTDLDVTDWKVETLAARVEAVLALLAEAKKRPTVGQIALAALVERILNGEKP